MRKSRCWRKMLPRCAKHHCQESKGSIVKTCIKSIKSILKNSNNVSLARRKQAVPIWPLVPKSKQSMKSWRCRRDDQEEGFNKNSGTGVQSSKVEIHIWKLPNRGGDRQRHERRDDLLTQEHKEKGKDTGQPGDRQKKKDQGKQENQNNVLLKSLEKSF